MYRNIDFKGILRIPDKTSIRELRLVDDLVEAKGAQRQFEYDLYLFLPICDVFNAFNQTYSYFIRALRQNDAALT